MILKQEKIHHFYKLIAYFIIGVSFLLTLRPFSDFPLQERFGIALVVNIGYHMFYYLISIIPLKQLNWVKDNSTIQSLAAKSFMVMSYFIILACILASIFIIKEAISNQEFYSLTTLLVFLGVILGALKLNLKLKNWKKPHYNNV